MRARVCVWYSNFSTHSALCFSLRNDTASGKRTNLTTINPPPKPVAVSVTTTSTHLPVTSRDVIGDVVEHSTSYEFNSLTYLLWLLPYLYLAWQFRSLSITWNFQLYEMRILIFIHICRYRPPFIVLCMSFYPVNWNKVWHRWVSTVCRSIRFVLYAILTASFRTFFLCLTNYSLAGGCQKGRR
jgi:hypothetical protein